MADNVKFEREDYAKAKVLWQAADDAVSGAVAVKARGVTYLPRTNPADKSADADARYKAYKERATFVPISARTLKSLVGAVFRKDPELELPSGIEYATADIDGAGNSIYQQSQRVLSDVLAKGRAFVLVDYPETPGGASRAEMAELRATVSRYAPECVINWRTETVGTNTRLSLVVLTEQVEKAGEFSTEVEMQYRVLRLIDGVYTVQLFDDQGEPKTEAVQPRDAAGNLWREIPGTFVGAENNDPEIDEAPLGDIVDLNLAHYRVYADWNKVLFLAANPQPVTAGLTVEWRDWMEQQGTLIGSDVNMLLPEGGSFQWAQINADQPLMKELEHLQAQMVSLGARLLEKGSAVMTATQARAENAAEYSVLALVAANVSEAYTKCLNWMARFMGAQESASYNLSREYVESELDAQMLLATVEAWQSRTVAKSDSRRFLRRVGFIEPDRTDEDIEAELQGDNEGLALDDADTIA